MARLQRTKLADDELVDEVEGQEQTGRWRNSSILYLTIVSRGDVYDFSTLSTIRHIHDCML